MVNNPMHEPDWPRCEECGNPFFFDYDEPFAFCWCGTTEWTGKRPKRWRQRQKKAEKQSKCEMCGTIHMNEKRRWHCKECGAVVCSNQLFRRLATRDTRHIVFDKEYGGEVCCGPLTEIR